jgi:tetratricopeptide (TPR) repeat protein
MTALLHVLLSLLLWTTTVEESALEQAVHAYRSGRYAQARELFQTSASEPGAAHGPLLYNLGNCAYRQGLYAQAVLDYARAELRLPNDPEIAFNRRLAERQLLLDVPDERPPLARARAFLDSLPPGLLLALSVALQTGGLLGLVLLASSRALRTKGWRRPLQGFSLALLLLGLAAAFVLVQAQWSGRLLEGVALEAADLHAEPRSDLPPTLTLQPGETVRILDQTERWIQVGIQVAGNQGSGWTERARIGVID